MNQGGFYKMIMDKMKQTGTKGIAGYRAVMWELGGGALAASICVKDAYNMLQTKYIQVESDFKTKYYEPCN
jgi:hypothetical protein